MSVAKHSRVWTDAYSRVGQVVEIRFGTSWHRGAVVGRTRSGLPIVALAGDRTGYDYRIDRKGDIRMPGLGGLTETTPSGTPVVVLGDNGSEWRTTTRSEPWQLGDGTWVVALEGKSGGYLASRVRIDEPSEHTQGGR